MSTIKRILSAPPYLVRSKTLNQLGYQKIRIFAKYFNLYKSRGKRIEAASAEAKKILEEIDRDGYAVIENFLPHDAFMNIKELTAHLKLKEESRKDGTAIDWRHGYIDDNEIVRKSLIDNKLLTEVVKAYTGKNITTKPKVIFQSLKRSTSAEDVDDVNLSLHADRFYPTLKLFLTCNEHTKENGAFRYLKRSHRMTEERRREEYIFSKNYFAKNVSKEFLDNNRVTFSQAFLNKYEEVQLCAPENTLIIADVCGYHARGKMLGIDAQRDTIRVIYHYLHINRVFQKLYKILNIDAGRLN